MLLVVYQIPFIGLVHTDAVPLATGSSELSLSPEKMAIVKWEHPCLGDKDP